MSKQSDTTHLLLLKLWSHLSKRRQSQFLILLLLMLISSVCEVISIGAVVPFLGVLTSPEYIQKNQYLLKLYPELATYDTTQIMQLITLVFVASIMVSSAIRLLLLLCNTKLAFSAGADLSIEVYKKTLFQPYETHTTKNSSEVISGILHKVHGVVNGELLPSIILINACILSIFITIAMVVANPILSPIAMLIFGLSYFILGFISKRKLSVNSTQISEMQTTVVKSLQEGLGGIREIILDNSQKIYVEGYKNAERPLQLAQSSNVVIAQSPRFVVETLGVIVLSVFAYVMIEQDHNTEKIIPSLGFLALCAQRLLPTLQQLYNAWASIIGSRATLQDTLNLLNLPIDDEHTINHRAIPFEKNIKFKNVSFKYQDVNQFSLKKINLTIPKSSKVGVVGVTGAGKSTLIDLMMGLLQPTEGSIFVDDKLLSAEVIHDWRSKISHVPQSIYLYDSTFAENIAFGIKKENINFEKVKYAAKIAQIAEFIESQPKQYLSKVTERGGNLSGGQRQRVGIARALYKSSSILILDEATSALDSQTELSILDSLAKLEDGMTIIMISHKIETLKNCDFLIRVKNHKVEISDKNSDEYL